MTQNPTFYCSRCRTTRPPLFARRSYTCVICGKSRTVDEYREEMAELRTYAAAPVSPAANAAPPPAEVTPEVAPVPVAPKVAQAVPVAETTCAWHACDAPPRAASKYCSRNCSNKNARFRHAQRKSA